MDIQLQLIPAQCGHCGYLYPSGFGFDPAETGVEVSMAVFENAEVAEPCPMCGRHRARVLAEEYQFVRDAEKLLRRSERDAADPKRLVAFLREVRGRGRSDDEIREEAREQAPQLSGLVEELLDARPAGVDVPTWHALLDNTLRALGTARDGEGEAGLIPSQVVYDSINEYNVTTVQPSSSGDTRHETHKVGRNDPCPCGSGKKYKKCHGSPTGGAANA
nr:SEC-C metal-binding domain-containing protein [Rubrobacter marinus]